VTPVRCAYCHGPAEETTRPCPKCQTLLHEDCWRLAGSCPTLGCGQGPARAPSRWAVVLTAALLLSVGAYGLHELTKEIPRRPPPPPPSVRSETATVAPAQPTASAREPTPTPSAPPLRATVLLRRADARYNASDWAAAVRFYDSAFGIDPALRTVASLVRVANARAALSDFEGALADLHAAMKLDPSSAAPYACRGSVWIHRGDPEAALRDFEKALRLHVDRATTGLTRQQLRIRLASAQASLASSLSERPGRSPEDEARALELLLHAAKAGLVPGMTQLGLFYERRRHSPPDLTQAAKWFRRAAEREDPRAMAHYGRVLVSGWVPGAAPEEGLTWLHRSADTDCHLGVRFLGECYEHGTCVEVDLRRALQLYERASKLNDSHAQVLENRVRLRLEDE